MKGFITWRRLKRVAFLFVAVLCISFGARHLARRWVAGNVSKLLSGYGLGALPLSCEGGFESRVGHCLFPLSKVNGSEFRSRTAEDLEAKRPAGQLPMNPQTLGDGFCDQAIGGVEPFVAKTQLGGGALPYLGRIYLDERAGWGCLEFQFGYG